MSGNTNALWPTKQSNPNQKKNEVDYPRVRPSRHVVRPGRHWPACPQTDFKAKVPIWTAERTKVAKARRAKARKTRGNMNKKKKSTEKRSKNKVGMKKRE